MEKTSATLKSEIDIAIAKLFEVAEDLTWNKLSKNCKFVIRQIKNSGENFHFQRRLRKEENDKMIPFKLDELIIKLQSIYDNLYDINLQIYKASESLTIIEISYYPKSSINNCFQINEFNSLPMLHCKVSMPPWLSDRKEKFDVNWEHNEIKIRWNLLLKKFKPKAKCG